MRRAGPVNRVGSVCQDLGTSMKHTKNQLRDHMEKFQHDAGIPASQYENLPCNRDCRASTASRANAFSSLNFASGQNGSPEVGYFSFYITR